MLRRSLTPLVRWRFFSLLILWLTSRMRPCDPRLSPIYGDLGDLPPTLIQASEAEMLLDDARRYANKAREAGSPVELETWPHVVHAFQAFGGEELEEAGEALERVRIFVERVAGS